MIAVIVANEWATTLSALVSGLGVGLFIDEVGKFITSTNDYFYPSAAPIVYVFFLLTVLLASRIRLGKPKQNRGKMYEVLERFSEVLDHDLSSFEREELLQSLSDVKRSSENQDLTELANALQQYLLHHKDEADTSKPNLLDRIRLSWKRFERKYLPKKRLRIIIIVGLFAWGVWALLSPIFYFLTMKNPVEFQVFLDQLISNNLLRSASGLTWFETRVILEGSFGLIACISAFLILCKSEKKGIWIG
ncbi:MAG: hypothetical protein HGB26_09230, partial [Desulfobulbaceae bacterium]|nr:hypothetical protein [Desulfobulbaceae bacterium]